MVCFGGPRYQHLGYPGGSMVKNLPASTGAIGDTGSILGMGRSPREENGNSFQYSSIGKPRDRITWQATVHGVAKSWT